VNDFLPQTSPNTLGIPSEPLEGLFGGWADMEQEAERAYLGTLMLKRPSDTAPSTVRLTAGQFSTTLRGKMLEAIRSLYPWTDSVQMERHLAATLSRQFGLKAAQMEIAHCLCHAEPWANVDAIAARVVEGWKRRERLRLLDGARASCHDSEAIAELCKQLAALG